MSQHANYWSCSKLADWLRGTTKPFALGWDEWEDWEADAAKAHPFRKWLADVALDKLQDFVCLPFTVYRNIRCYCYNRWVDRCHLIVTGLEPGYWHEFEDKVLHGLFNELVEFVEVELSLHYRAWNDGPRKPRRSAEWGLKSLDWQISLVHGDNDGVKEDDPFYGKPTPQSVAALETKTIYLWWKEVRPKRIDPFDLVEENPIEDTYQAKYGRMSKLEQEYEDEDTEMMVRLIKLRRSLWT